MTIPNQQIIEAFLKLMNLETCKPVNSPGLKSWIKAQSAECYENEDNDKYTEKKPTTALRKFPFTYKESLESTCNKQHLLVGPNRTFVSR